MTRRLSYPLAAAALFTFCPSAWAEDPLDVTMTVITSEQEMTESVVQQIKLPSGLAEPGRDSVNRRPVNLERRQELVQRGLEKAQDRRQLPSLPLPSQGTQPPLQAPALPSPPERPEVPEVPTSQRP